MNSLFKDLGIFKLHSNNDPSLNQGLKYDEYRKKALDSTSYELLQQSTTPNLNSIVEAMKADNSNNSSQAGNSNAQGLTEISSLDNKFQKLITEYTTILKLVNEEAVHKENNYSIAKNMFGKVVKNIEGSMVYVNNYGYTHKYSTDAWDNNGEGCPTNPMEDNGALSNLPSGPEMGVGQACGIAGKNIKNNKTGEMAWVDIRGIKHVYSKNIWNKRSASCVHRNLISLSDSQYRAIPTGASMTSTNNCMNIDVDPTLYSKLNSINKELSSMAAQLIQEIDKLKITDAKLSAELQQQRADLNSYLDNLSSDKTALQRVDSNYNTLLAKKSDSRLMYTANNYELIAWTISALAIGGITLHQIMKTR